jgi:hypothetical protein
LVQDYNGVHEENFKKTNNAMVCKLQRGNAERGTTKIEDFNLPLAANVKCVVRHPLPSTALYANRPTKNAFSYGDE